LGALSNEATISVIVTPVNDPPVIIPITVTINEDEPATICFTISDIENDPAIFTSGVSLGGNGTVVSAPSSGSLCFLYTPNLDYNGTDQVQVTVCDTNNPTVCGTGIITIIVLPVNDAPKIVKNGEVTDKVNRTTPEDTPLNFCFDVIDPEGDNFSVSNVANVAGGGTMVMGTGGANELCFTFTPVPDFNGLSIWSVTICDDATPSMCGTFTIVIDVTPVNDAPIASSLDVTLPEDTPTEITLIGTDVDGDELAYTIVGGPSHGVLSGTGANVTYTPDTDYVGNDSFTYKVNDGTIDSDIVTVSITVTPVNDAPIITEIPVLTTPEDTPLDICLGVTDSDGDQVTYQSPVMISGGGSMSPSASFDFCFTFLPAQDFNGVSEWKFTVCDNGNPAKCSEVTVQIIVTPVNDPPIAVNDYITAQCSVTTEPVNILENDIDVDGDDLILTTLPLAGPFHGSVTMNADGSFTYKSDFGYIGADSVRYQVCDNGIPSLCDEGVVFIEVGPAPFKIYNGLSPNGDGLNDYWRIDGIEAYPNNRVRIFDRYNNMIFETSGYNNEGNSWRGQVNHSMISGNVTEGTYFYSVDLGDGTDLYSGYVVLKKN
jgi:gliding motility-associated-like protein